MFAEIVTAGKACRAAATELSKQLANVKLDKFQYARLLVALRRIETCIFHLTDAYKDTKDYIPLGVRAAEDAARKAAEREQQQSAGAGGVGASAGPGRDSPPPAPPEGDPGPPVNGQGGETGPAPGRPAKPVGRDKRTAVPKGPARRPESRGKSAAKAKGGRK